MSAEGIDGWSEVVAWFDYSPNFHDAEIVSIDLRRDPEPSLVCLHAWRTNDDLDENGYYRLDRHALVTFQMRGITALRIADWNHQNVVSGLWVDAKDGGQFTLNMPGIFGADGEITASDVTVSIEPWQASA